MKKKILSLLLVLVMTICLVACDFGGAKKITVSFDTNGGNTIESVEVKVDDALNFKLPENPKKEGYVFKGWYIDSEFKTEFDKIDLEKGEITLYAKWEVAKTPEEINQENLEGSWYGAATKVKFANDKTFAIQMPGLSGEVSEYEGTYTVDALGNVSFNFRVGPFTAPSLTAKLENGKLAFNVLGAKLELNKAPDFTFVTVPTDLIDLVKELDAADLTAKGKIEIKTTPGKNANLEVETPEVPSTGTITGDIVGGITAGITTGIVQAIVQLISNTHVTLDYQTTIKVANIKSEKIEDIKAYVGISANLDVEFMGEKAGSEEFDTILACLNDIKLFINEGKLYFYINMPLQEEVPVDGSEYETVTRYYNEPRFGYVDLKKVQEYLVENIEDLEKSDFELPEEIPAELVEILKSGDAFKLAEYINNTVNDLLGNLYMLGFAPDFIKETADLITMFGANEKKEGNKTSFELTTQDVTKNLEKLLSYVKSNKEVLALVLGMINSEDEEFNFEEVYKQIVEGITVAKESIKINSFKYAVEATDKEFKGQDCNIDVELNLDDSINFAVKVVNEIVNAGTPKFEFGDVTDYEDITDLFLEIFENDDDEIINIGPTE